MPRRLVGKASIAVVIVGLAAVATSGQETLPPSGQSGVVHSGSAAQNTNYQLPQRSAGGYRIQPAREPAGFHRNDPRFDGRWDRGRPFPATMRANGFVPPLNDTREGARPPNTKAPRDAGAATRPSRAPVSALSPTTLHRDFPNQRHPGNIAHVRPLQRPTTRDAVRPLPSRLTRLPRVHPAQGAPHFAKVTREFDQPVDGTWREDVDHIIINFDGRELKLAKTGPPSGRAGAPDPRLTAGGSVHGRLLHRGLAVVNCRVVIVPLIKNFGTYQVDGDGEPLSTLTDERGIYDFANVPKGRYKVFWLPEGSRQWVRRIEFRPDAVVKTGKPAKVKDVRTALRTIN